MNFREYIAPFLVLILVGLEGLLSLSFIGSNLRVSDGTVFTLSTIGPSIASTVFAAVAFAGLIPSVRRKFEGRAHLILIILMILASILLAAFAVQNGSLEYTQFQTSAG